MARCSVAWPCTGRWRRLRPATGRADVVPDLGEGAHAAQVVVPPAVSGCTWAPGYRRWRSGRWRCRPRPRGAGAGFFPAEAGAPTAGGRAVGVVVATTYSSMLVRWPRRSNSMSMVAWAWCRASLMRWDAVAQRSQVREVVSLRPPSRIRSSRCRGRSWPSSCSRPTSRPPVEVADGGQVVVERGASRRRGIRGLQAARCPQSKPASV